MQPFLIPARPKLAEARAAVQGAATPQVAWQQLVERGVLPADWLTSARRFVHDPMDGDFERKVPTRDPAFAPQQFWPQTIEQCVLIAADVEGILRAEGAAMELGQRLAPGKTPLCQRVVWWMVPRGQFGRASADTRPGVIYALAMAFVQLHQAAPDAINAGLFGNAERWATVWNNTPAVNDRPNPFEPLLVIEGSGYSALEYIGGTGAANGAIVLVAPTD